LRSLDPTVLAKIGALRLRARTIVEGALTGLHRSPHHGSSIEFAQHKEYSPGDEIRHIDWKAVAKSDRYYVKRYEDETELSAHLVIDTSGSMSYRDRTASKLEYAVFLAAALAYLLIRQQDRVGLHTTGPTPIYVPPRARTTHLHDLLATLDRLLEGGGAGETRVAATLDRVGELVRRRRSLVILFSDLFDAQPVTPLLRRLRAQGHDVVVFQLLDRDELELPFEGITLFQSLEDDRRLLADPRAVRTPYLRELHDFLDRVRRDCTEGGVEHHLIATDRPLERTLLDFLSARAVRHGRRGEL
jgi:uncharacterized protein (DUF58 family)